MMNFIEKHTHILLIVLLFISSFIRFYKISEIPSFHGDEVDFGYNAYSLLKTGKDFSGVSFPIGTTSAGDFRPALYTYLTTASIAIFGFNEFAIRLPSILFSVLTILLLYAFARMVFSDTLVALFSSMLLTFSFWHITLSREASEKIVALFLVIFGMYFLMKFITSERKSMIISSMIIFFLSIHTYYSPRLFLLLFLPIVYVFYQKKLEKKSRMWFAWSISILLMLILFFTFSYKTSTERISQLLIFRHPQTMTLLQAQIREDGRKLPVLLTRLFHNKLVNFSYVVARNFGEYFSPNYLFFDGGYPKRVRVPNIGLLNIVELPFLLYGIYLLIDSRKKEKKQMSLFLVSWGLLSFVPVSLTFDEIPNVYRTLLALPVFNLITAYGCVQVARSNIFKKSIFKIFGTFLVTVYLFEFVYFLHQYFIHFDIYSSVYRNSAQKELAQVLRSDYKKKTIIYIPKVYGGVEQMLRYYLKYDPVDQMNRGYPRDKDYTGFENIVFVPEACPYPDLLPTVGTSYTGTAVFVDSFDCRSRNVSGQNESVVRWKDGTTAYYVIKVPIQSAK